MNSFVLATQISWTLQAAIAITFAVALGGLALQLQRTGTSALALAWLWTTVGLCAVATQSYVDSTGTLPYPLFLFGGLTIAGIGGSVPAFEYAADALTSTTTLLSRGALLKRTFVWAAACFALTGVLVLLGTTVFDGISGFVGITGRLVLVLLYVRVTFHLLRRRRLVESQFSVVLGIMAAATLLQAIRPLIVLLLFQGPPTGSINSPGAVAFVGFHVFAGTTFGVACLLLALAEERAAMLESGRQLRDAALRLERSHRLESVGRLASGVAHDFNNLLTVITSSAALARESDQSLTQIAAELGEIEKAAERGAGLTRQLLAYARQQPQHVLQFDAGERLQQMSSLLARLVGRGVVIDVIAPTTSALVSMDPSTFEQVVVNLVVNARDAIADTGRIAVSLVVTQLAAPRTLADGELGAGSYVSLAVTDNGRGIEPEILDRLFEPFFTTRQEVGGTGLGLATVHSIVRQAGGDVTVASRPDDGTTFTVLLPIAVCDTAPSAY